MYIIVGLGNPDKKYEHTRHNVGFDVLSVLSSKLNIPITKSHGKALVGEGTIDGQKIALAAPQTYMNLSGEAVVALMNWYKVDASHVILIFDDVDLPEGQIRIRRNGSAGTHNGMRNIVSLTGRQDFARIRVGINVPRNPNYQLRDFVLGKYTTPEERKIMFDAFMNAADAAVMMISEGIDKAMAKYNGKSK